ncbi:MAG: FAD-binding oxidoreductase [Candidatus Harrisonbacteria bacterium CG10_big_fil_rev_8_21_14_0_10_38_8]|uniref:D-lactate dehydrogenase (cytochrome) n=1 Tax=Candidatus Harrisonbacteria bacterium CG10_big_fil_rev_8_21_14_0_10_38_8 TaxID=1974582 RepID=A0A2M6WKF9_9BACT|nr:MAG: FAD-binding oxidoreductase [Candidatus Harrisonbacteria bacterium CG10_big_fil_rev_8_21_14_0_10_38_8]
MLKDDLKSLIQGDVIDEKETLEKFSHDASIFEVKPEIVVAPKDSEDVKNIVKYVRENEGYSITPRSGGTCMSGGPLGESIVLDMVKYMNGVEDVVFPEKDKGEDEAPYASVLPGTYYRDFDKETKRRSLMMPSYPASREICTVGGMVGNNAGGEKTPVYGKTEDYIKALKVVLSDGNEYIFKALEKEELEAKMKLVNFEGEVYKKMYELLQESKDLIASAKPKVSKNSAGYYLWNVWDGKTFDLTKLFVGSQGTLGVITDITFRLVPVKPASRLLVIFLKDISHIGELVVELKKYSPETIESYDDKTFKLGIKFLPQMIKLLHGRGGLISKMFNLFPELMMAVKGGIPKMVIMSEFTGEKDEEVLEIAQQAELAIKKFSKNTHITQSKDEEEAFWIFRRESFNLMRNKIKDRHTAPFIDDFAVLPEYLPEFLPKVDEILNQYPGLVYGVMGHPGDGNFHIVPLMNLEEESQRSIIPRLSDQIYNLVLEYKGTITAEHNDGLIRTPYLEKMYGKEVTELFSKTKKIFDPKNIFNPRKKVNPDLPFALSHIRKSF